LLRRPLTDNVKVSMLSPDPTSNRKKIWIGLTALALLIGAGLGRVALATGASPDDSSNSESAIVISTPAPAPTCARADDVTPPGASLEELLSSAAYDTESGGYVAHLSDGTQPKLTLLPTLQESAERILATYKPPLGELVALDPATGRILAWARTTTATPQLEAAPDGPSGDAFPAASVFKLVTASALLERGVTPDEEVCYHGGKHRIHEKQLADDDARDFRCVSLSQAIARSANVAIAKLADRDLDPVWLRTWADRLLFNHPLPTSLALAISTAQIPDDRFDFANTAAGFGNVTLTPLHGASLAGAIGHDGVLVSPHLSEDGTLPPSQQLLPQEMARQLSEMMTMTVREGTAHKAFRSRAARALDAAGKTGSLAAHTPYRDYSWFVGFAPALSPRIAVAAIVVNDQHWRVHASQLASSVLQSYLTPPKAHQLTAAK
jgi:cell division protein FtsI/penicillin-binding protein 2